MDTKKAEILDHLSKTEFINHDKPEFYHGRIYKNVPPVPDVKWECKYKQRRDQDCPDWLTGTEYCDTKNVFDDKIKKLARLLRLSKKTVIYSGAGISVSAGINQAARTDAEFSDLTTDAEPSVTHRALTALRENRLISDWVQQNHDGLPQKAGYPQEDIYEIHGSWYNPCNPVVTYGGVMRSDLFRDMRDAADTADLVLVLGTSLSGLNSDRVAIDPAKRSLKGNSLGTVIINLQQTAKDGVATLRLFAETDHVFQSLLTYLGIEMNDNLIKIPENKVIVPYNANGNKSDKIRMNVDLSEGQKIRLNPDHNCQGSGQSKLLHIYGKGTKDGTVVFRKPGPGNGYVVKYLPSLYAWELNIEGQPMLLGRWWLEVAARGKLDAIPVINIDPVMGCVNDAGECEYQTNLLTDRVSLEDKIEKERKEKEKLDAITNTVKAQESLDEIQNDADEIEAILEKALKNMEKTRNIAQLLKEMENKSVCHDETEKSDNESKQNGNFLNNGIESDMSEDVPKHKGNVLNNSIASDMSEDGLKQNGDVLSNGNESDMAEDEQLAFAVQMSIDS